MILNPEILDVETIFICKHKLADYLIYKGKLPLLGMKNGNFYFAKTKEFNDVYDNLPIWYKLFK